MLCVFYPAKLYTKVHNVRNKITPFDTCLCICAEIAACIPEFYYINDVNVTRTLCCQTFLGICAVLVQQVVQTNGPS